MNIYLNTSKMEPVDCYGGKETRIPQLVYGVSQRIKVILTVDGMTPCDMSNIVACEVALDADRDCASTVVCFAGRENIEIIDNTLEFEFNTLTEEFFNRVNGKGQVALICEICGFAADGKLSMRVDFPIIGMMSVYNENTLLPSSLPSVNARLAELSAMAENIIKGQ